MTFFANHGTVLKLPNKTGVDLDPDGGVILACLMPSHQLIRQENLVGEHPHLRRRLFDPQLYLASLDPNQSRSTCTKLASYSWFGLTAVDEYDSGQQSQREWKKAVATNLSELWPRKRLEDTELINIYARDCLDFQMRLGCRVLIAPSPLTIDLNTDYTTEINWLDGALEYVQNARIEQPLYATIALSDSCVSSYEPKESTLLDMILDVVTARQAQGVRGVYIVLEQGREPDASKHCSNTRALQSVLHLVHVLAQDAQLKVAVNFLGQFGLACEAAGASLWASDWYKSSYRLRLADKIGEGRALPSYWSHKAALEIHLEKDFDTLSGAGLLRRIADMTEASSGLLAASSGGMPANQVPNWKYGLGNVLATREHFLRSCIQAESVAAQFEGKLQRDHVEDWLQNAAQFAREIETTLGSGRKTNTPHVQSWYDAFRRYRADHNV